MFRDRHFHLRASLLIVLVTSLIGCATPVAGPVALSDLSPQAQHQTKTPSPSLWRIEGPTGTNVYLFGSIHALPHGLNWRTPLFDEIVASSEKLIIERTPIYNTDETLTIVKFIAENGYAKTEGGAMLAKLERRYHRPARKLWLAAKPDLDGDGKADAFLRTRAWYYFAMTASSPDIPVKNLKVTPELLVAPAAGVDAVLVREFGPERVRAIVPTIDTLNLIAGLTDEEALSLIRHRLDSIAESRQDLIATLDKEILIRNAWLRGDDDAFLKAYRAREQDAPAIKDEVLIKRRNKRWLSEIESVLKSGTDTMIVLGAAHLPGNDGMIALLTKHGYNVERIQGQR